MNQPDRTIEEFLVETLAASRGDDIAQIRELALAAQPIDSIEGVELILAAESEYGVEIPDDALSPAVCSSFKSLADLISSRIGN